LARSLPPLHNAALPVTVLASALAAALAAAPAFHLGPVPVEVRLEVVA
jgi:formate-dependent nitrite reductase membrane component NrfD